ncbi:MAG: hypothetical protein ACPG4Z_06865 [Chitinophagales bacterium]
MKYLVSSITLLALILFSCTDTSNTENATEEYIEREIGEEHISKTQVTDVDETIYFEDYAQYNTRKLLFNQFDSEYIKDDTTWYAEGTEMYLRSTLTNPIDNNVIRFLWKQNNAEKLEFIETDHTLYNEEWEIERTQNVMTKTGIYLGMTLFELRDWNGAEFDFLGFGWDYEGSIMAEENSKLSNNNVQARLSISYDSYDDDYMGDILFNTKDIKTNNDIYVETIMMSVE